MSYPDLEREIEDGVKNAENSHNRSSDTVRIISADPIDALCTRVTTILTENNELKIRVKDLEDKMQSIMFMLNLEKNKGSIKVPCNEYFNGTPSETQSVMSLDTKMHSSEYNVSNMSMGSYSSTMMRTTATSAMGYTNKKSVWGTALASMLIAAVRYYNTKTDGKKFMLDETKIMKTCICMSSVLYEMSAKELPGVKTATTMYMSEAISRITSNDVPQSNAEFWYEMLKTQDGRDCITVIETMIKHSKKMSEVLGHPLSSLVVLIRFPVVRKIKSGDVILSISNKMPMKEQPSQWDSWCSLLKNTALIRYAKWRSNDYSPSISASNMIEEMKIEELVDKKNTTKFYYL